MIKVAAVRDAHSTMSDAKNRLSASESEIPSSVEEIYNRHAPLVERWVRRLAGPRIDPEDLLHDVFLVVMRRRHEFRGEAKLSTWLFKITQHVVRWRRRNDAVRRLLWGKHGQAFLDASPSVPSPVEEMLRRERSLRLYEAMDHLSERHRTVLILFALEGLSGEAIAELTGADVRTVWVWLHRGRAKLAEVLAAEEKER